ncbi:GntR family transcriptional regulator [Herbiconiux daphne]|uniref:GntR family transcriptional regulator n=1 Tax=Herbiconiux daphne TaxID=2970914 RepID=A0ABT2H5U5_9MICO|nr:GntR family transcriptional regulator [Herbiconiux daphne]MCS5735297.1 GntR family transcriptional regulator [Herbiconiux daphne]
MAQAGRGAQSGRARGGVLGIGLRVDAASAVPPFEQLRAAIRDAVASGQLAAGVRLPTVRALAAELGLAVNTVARAYRELETDALIETRGRLGSFVATTGSPARQELQAAARVFADRATTLGIDAAEALDLAAAALGVDIPGVDVPDVPGVATPGSAKR